MVKPQPGLVQRCWRAYYVQWSAQGTISVLVTASVVCLLGLLSFHGSLGWGGLLRGRLPPVPKVVFSMSTVPHRLKFVDMLLGRFFRGRGAAAPGPFPECEVPASGFEVRPTSMARTPCWLSLRESEPDSMLQEVWLSKPERPVSLNDTYGPLPLSLTRAPWFRNIEIPRDWGPASKLLGGVWVAEDPPERMTELTMVVGDDDVVYRSGVLNLLATAAQALSTDSGLALARHSTGATNARGFVVSSTVMPLRSERHTWRPMLALSWPPHVVEDCRPPGSLPLHGVDIDLDLKLSPQNGLGLGPTLNSEYVQDQPAVPPRILGDSREGVAKVRTHLVYGDLVRGVGAFALMPGRLPSGWANAAATLAGISKECLLSDDLTLSIAFQITGVGILGVSASKDPRVFEEPAFDGGLPGHRLAHVGDEQIEESARRTEQRYIKCINQIELWWAKKKRQAKSRSFACASLTSVWHVNEEPPNFWRDREWK